MSSSLIESDNKTQIYSIFSLDQVSLYKEADTKKQEIIYILKVEKDFLNIDEGKYDELFEIFCQGFTSVKMYIEDKVVTKIEYRERSRNFLIFL